MSSLLERLTEHKRPTSLLDNPIMPFGRIKLPDPHMDWEEKDFNYTFGEQKWNPVPGQLAPLLFMFPFNNGFTKSNMVGHLVLDLILTDHPRRFNLSTRKKRKQFENKVIAKDASRQTTRVMMRLYIAYLVGRFGPDIKCSANLDYPVAVNLFTKESYINDLEGI